jgi:hypothetical protein
MIANCTKKATRLPKIGQGDAKIMIFMSYNLEEKIFSGSGILGPFFFDPV